MKRPVKVPLLYNRTGNCITSCPADIDSTTQQQPKSYSFTHRNQFPRPSFSQRAHLNGILHTPDDAVFVIITILFIFWSLVRLFCLELPYFILTGFRRSTKQHPVEWSWWASALFSILRCGCSDIDTMGQARFIGLLLNSFMPLQMLFLPKKIKITKGIKFKVKLDVLLRPERASLTEVRAQLLENYPNFSDDPMNPSESYLKSMHPRGPNAPLANIPEEVGPLDTDGTYTLTGEWIEALEDSSKSSNKPRSNTVVLYFHGGAHIICSSKTHRHTLARLAMEIGPGTRIFSVDYRLAPENPFPASVHDAFAAFLYLTEPNHTALVLDDGDNSAATVHQLPIDPRNIVVAGDSAGGNIAAAFMLYMNKYVQPSTEPKFILPHAALLLSPWMDITSSLPAGKSFDWHCFCPGPIGTSPFDKKAFIEYKKQNYACIYVCGDKNLVPNARNALGKDRYWQWYTHLAQHPLISIAFANEGSLGGFTNTLFQTATHDRLVDDSRLFAHRIGMEHPDRIIRVETYRDMVHVHQILSLLFESSRIAIKNIARFIERSERLRDGREQKLAAVARTGIRTKAGALVHHHQGTNKNSGVDGNNRDEYIPAYLLPNMVKEKAAWDGVEWVMIEQNGRESTGGEGKSLASLVQTWHSVENNA